MAMTFRTTVNTATWADDGVSITVAYHGPETDEFGTRDVWAYAIRVGDWEHSGHDLHGPATTTSERNPRALLASLLSFLSSDAEKYQRLMGPAPEDDDGYLFPLWLAEWAYLNDDLLSMASLELSDDADDQQD